ncbi:MAG TPA: alpha/beta hydrolase [Balneolaceae bacterium]|nr:alpha/beta hydrolase [Balneolaceae bacterium]
MDFNIQKMRAKTIYLALLLALPITLKAQQTINLYSGEVPNSKQTANTIPNKEQPPGVFRSVTHPTLEVYLPEKQKATGTAVVICPGGGYSVVVYQAEGVQTAKEFAKNGIAAFVLKYRLPRDSTMIDKTTGPLQDAQRAIKMVRENADKWKIDKHKVGIMGFSAGGHLASTEATHYRKAVIENEDHTNLRPDFQILIYPVISMQDDLTHMGSRVNLLGKNPSKKLIDKYSNELQVDDNTPPAYITQAEDDSTVSVDNSIVYFQKLRRHNIPAELQIYPKGGHGFVLHMNTADWTEPIFKWMERSGWMSRK